MMQLLTYCNNFIVTFHLYKCIESSDAFLKRFSYTRLCNGNACVVTGAFKPCIPQQKKLCNYKIMKLVWIKQDKC